jgi:predicted nucleic acid-binding protein
MKLYIETSVPNFLFADDAPEKQEITKKFFNNDINKFELFISDLVLNEFAKSPQEKKTKLREIMSKLTFKELKTDEESEKLADEYVKAKIIPEKFRNDALHIAIAVVNKLDVVVSWNMQHIVKLKTITGVNRINRELKYSEILINTPEEVIE